jgi:acyl-CoA reductase-like NAD-dependent aldehyde dehydrogenase
MPELHRFHNVVAGWKLVASSGYWLASANPFTGKNWAEVPHCGPADGFVHLIIFADVANTMRIAHEEVFAPALSIIPFDDEDDAMAMANDTPHDLAAGLWMQNIRRTAIISERLQGETGWINTYRTVSFMAPFSGFEQSGLSRESGQKTLNEYLQTRCVWIKLAEAVASPFVLH